MGGGGQGWAVDEAAMGFQVGIVVPKLPHAAAGGNGGGPEDCVVRLVRELEDASRWAARRCVHGVPAEFIKLAAPMGTVGRAAAETRMKKLTYMGMELQFQRNQIAAFITSGSQID